MINAHPSSRWSATSQILLLILVAPFVVPLVLIFRVSTQGGVIENYRTVLSGTPFFRFFLNSVIVSVATTATVLVVALAASFALVHLKVRGRSIIFGLIVAAMSLPAISLLVPLFQLMKWAGLFNNYLAVITPLVAVSLPIAVLLIRNYLSGIPQALVDAARVDGAGDLRILLSILVPLARPVIAVVLVLTFFGAWNEYLLPLVFMQDIDSSVVTQVPTYFQSYRQVNMPRVFAASILVSVPVVVFYLVAQRQVRRGFAGGALK